MARVTTPSLVLRDVELDGARVDVAVAGGSVTALLPSGTARGDVVIEGRGGAILPGLHDHHLHLLAFAARHQSVSAGPPAVGAPADFDRVVAEADARTPPGEWLRVVGHEDEVGGPLDRARLDRLAPGRAVRVQHHSGALWTLSSTALTAIGIDVDARRAALPDGVEVDASGRPTGRFWRLDDWLRERLPAVAQPDLAAVGRRLASLGITGVTDATPTDDASAFELLAAAVTAGSLPVEVTVTGGVALAASTPPAPLRRGPVKLIVADHDLPGVADVAARIADAHGANRPVAIHCVTLEAAALCVAAWQDAGARAGDRMEHGSVLDLPVAGLLAELGITVVTQPAFVRDRGDHYLAAVDPDHHDDLYRCASLEVLGVRVGGSSDAPFGDVDPWRAIAAAVDRRTAQGAVLAPREAVDARRALGLYLTRPDDPGGATRRVSPTAVADLCVLDRPLADTLRRPDEVGVVATVRAGVVSHDASG